MSMILLHVHHLMHVMLCHLPRPEEHPHLAVGNYLAVVLWSEADAVLVVARGNERRSSQAAGVKVPHAQTLLAGLLARRAANV